MSEPYAIALLCLLVEIRDRSLDIALGLPLRHAVGSDPCYLSRNLFGYLVNCYVEAARILVILRESARLCFASTCIGRLMS